ncbi:MAG: hypothetical protein QOJ17_3637 [Rhodospirillaceae bacterium]|jgi:hypothetical protein|nr:hypothetical protein [Rhodospirillaceae bacterium]
MMIEKTRSIARPVQQFPVRELHAMCAGRQVMRVCPRCPGGTSPGRSARSKTWLTGAVLAGRESLTISQGRNRFHGQRNGPSVDLSLAGLVPRPVGIPRRFNSSASARWETKPSAISFRMVEANAKARESAARLCTEAPCIPRLRDDVRLLTFSIGPSWPELDVRS